MRSRRPRGDAQDGRRAPSPGCPAAGATIGLHFAGASRIRATRRLHMASETDRIEKQILLRAPRSRVWRALSDAKEFGAWFGVDLEGPFAPGASVRGKVTHPVYEHMTFELEVERMEPERLFSWRWHPAALEPGVAYSKEPATLVVFELEEKGGGTLLKVVESGFDRVPVARRAKAYRLNEEGWGAQMKAIEQHLAKAGERWPATPR